MDSKKESVIFSEPDESGKVTQSRFEIKKKIYKDLYESEYEYSNILVRMLGQFRQPLRDFADKENPAITHEQIDTLFFGFDSLLNLSWSLCGELKLISKLYDQEKVVNIGNVFLKHASEFEVYSKYSYRYSTANELLRELNQNNNFRRYQYALLESTTYLKDDDYREVLRLPIYRIENYYNTLKLLLDNTAKYDSVYEVLEDSYEYIEEIYLELKESLKKEMKIDEILEIQSTLIDCPKSIVKTERYLYRDYPKLVDLSTGKPYRVIVFSDIMVLGKWNKKAKRFAFDRVINYRGLKVLENVSKTDPTQFSFLLLNPFTKKNYDIYPKNQNIKDKGNKRGRGGYGYRGSDGVNEYSNGNGNGSFSKLFSRLFSWSFNQNITRIDLKAEDVETAQHIIAIINKRISELHPPPFELLWPDPKDIFDIDIVKGIRNPVPAEPSEIILNSFICNGLYRSFPKRLRIKRSLTLLYSLQQHGSSINTFYERSNAGYGTAQILVIKDENENIFGVFSAEPFKVYNGFYGTGESFLFKVIREKKKKMKKINSHSMSISNIGKSIGITGRKNSHQIHGSSLLNNQNSLNRLRNKNSASPPPLSPLSPLSKLNSPSSTSATTTTASSPSKSNTNKTNTNTNINTNTNTKSVNNNVNTNTNTNTNTDTLSRINNQSSATTTTFGECQVKVFPWAKTNYLFINSTQRYIGVGSGKGKYGLWCDSQFQYGQSNYTETYHNDILSSTERFNIMNVELWTFTSQIEREVRKKRPTRFPTKFQMK